MESYGNCVYSSLCKWEVLRRKYGNLEERLKRHNAGYGCGFTKAHLPVKLIYKEEYPTIEEAYQRERQLHGWSRAKKEALINGDMEELKKQSKCGSTSSPTDAPSTNSGTREVEGTWKGAEKSNEL